MLPAEPPATAQLKQKRRKSQEVEAQKTAKQREVILRHLGQSAKTSTTRTDAPTQAFWARHHLHPSIIALCRTKASGIKLPDSVSDEIVLRIKNGGSSYTEVDRFADGTFAPVPNYSLGALEDDVALLERAASTSSTPSISPAGVSTPCSSSSLSSSSMSPGGIGHKRQRTSPSERAATTAVAACPEAAAAQISILDQEVQNLMQQLTDERKHNSQAQTKHDEELTKRMELSLKFEKSLLAEGGMSRFTLTNDSWHAKNKGAA